MGLLNFFKKKEKNETERRDKKEEKIKNDNQKKYKEGNYMKQGIEELTGNDKLIDINNYIEVIHRLRIFHPLSFEKFI